MFASRLRDLKKVGHESRKRSTGNQARSMPAILLFRAHIVAIYATSEIARKSACLPGSQSFVIVTSRNGVYSISTRCKSVVALRVSSIASDSMSGTVRSTTYSNAQGDRVLLHIQQVSCNEEVYVV